MRRRQQAIERTIEHPIRRRWIEALWHSGEALSSRRFHADYLADGPVTISTVSFHARVLVAEGIAEVERSELTGRGTVERFYVLGGPNSAEAIRRLWQAQG